MEPAWLQTRFADQIDLRTRQAQARKAQTMMDQTVMEQTVMDQCGQQLLPGVWGQLALG
jgi:hypothetical protein